MRSLTIEWRRKTKSRRTYGVKSKTSKLNVRTQRKKF